MSANIRKLEEKHRKELESLEREKMESLRERDLESVAEIEKEQRENEEKLRQAALARETMRVDLLKLLDESKEKIEKLEKELTQRKEGATT